MIALLCGCASMPSGTSNSGASQNLPQLPGGLADWRHSVAEVEATSIYGAAAASHSSSAMTVGSSLQLTATAEQPCVEWAVWRLSVPDGSVPKSAALEVSVDSGSSAWVGIADYNAKAWKLSGPFTSSGSRGIAPLAARHVSPGGNIFVLAAAYSGTQITVNRVDFEIDVPAPPKYFITGTLSDSTIGGLSNLEVTLNPGNLHATTDKDGNYTFVDLEPGNYILAPPAVANHDVEPPSLPVDLSTASFTAAHFAYTAQATGLTYTNSIKLLLDTKCVGCHNPSQPGRACLDVYIRQDSNDVWHNAEDSLLYVESAIMPPADPLNASQRKLLKDWIQLYNKAE